MKNSKNTSIINVEKQADHIDLPRKIESTLEIYKKFSTLDMDASYSYFVLTLFRKKGR
jgi:hypothetical protein